MRSYVLLVLVITSVTAAFGTILDGGWRISVGASYNAPTRVRLKFNPIHFVGSGAVAPTMPGMTYEQAKAAAEGTQSGDYTLYDYDGTGRYISRYSPKDSRHPSGEDDDEHERGSWNVRVYKGETTVDGDSFTLSSVEYGYLTSEGDGCGRLKLHECDDEATPGVNLELSRNLYHNDEYHYGVDLAFAVNWFFGRNIFRAGSSYVSDSSVYKSGKLESTITPVDGYIDPWRWDDDPEYYGTGRFDAIGPTFNRPQLSEIAYPDVHYGSSGCLGARGDYWDVELMLALRPYYDVFEWLRVYGTFGVAVSRAEFDLRVSGMRDGVGMRYHHEYSSWDVYGVGGLGLMLRWKDFCLGLDVIARFWDDDLDISDDVVRGSLRRGRWMFKGCVGYEF